MGNTAAEAKPRLNDKLINCVLDHIEYQVKHHTGKYNQNDWATIDWEMVDKAVKEGEDTDIDQAMCGTQGCFAGWACMLSTPVKEWRKMLKTFGDWPTEGMKRLGLTHDEANFLFGSTNAGGPQAQLEVIQGRVRVIRECRAKGLASVWQHADFDEYDE